MKKAVTSLFVAVILIAWCGLGWALHTRQDSAAAPMGQPQRIVSLTPDVTEILFALGLGDKVVGVSTYCNYPPDVNTRPRVGTYWEPDIEAIIAFKPDLVTGERSSKSDVLSRLERIGYPTASVKMDTLADLMAVIDNIAALTGDRAAADALKSDIQSRLGTVSLAVTSKPKVGVLWVVQVEPLRAAGRNTFVNEMIELAGGRNVVTPTRMDYPPVGIEYLLGAQVDVIIQPAMIGNISISRQQADARAWWARWPAIPAVKNGLIYVIPPDTVSRLGPRLPVGVEMIARLLHPECFADVTGDTGK